MTEPCNMELGHALGLDAYDGARQDDAQPAPTPHRRPEPLDAKLAELAQRLRHDAVDLRERACRLPLGRRRHRLFSAAVNADWAALEIEALPEAADIDAMRDQPLGVVYPPRIHRHG